MYETMRRLGSYKSIDLTLALAQFTQLSLCVYQRSDEGQKKMRILIVAWRFSRIIEDETRAISIPLYIFSKRSI